MDQSSLIQHPVDRLQVFVSSTIAEAADERAAAREAIRSLNHQPVLFEEIGARPYPPRIVYRPRLAQSHLFVAIYKHSYGWIAPDMEVSGIEDEFEIASELGMDRLIYVFSDGASRDPRLEALVEKAKSSVTIAHYSSYDELRDRIRDDLTAVIATRFLEQAVVVEEVAGPLDIIESTLPNRGHRFHRSEVERLVIEALDRNGRLMITGALGSGKSILLAQLAVENDWIYINAQGLSTLDLLAKAANALQARLGKLPIAFASEEAARLVVTKALDFLSGATLAIDDPVEPNVLWNLASGKNRIVLTSRQSSDIPSSARLEIPPLSHDEIATWVAGLRGSRPDDSELTNLADRSGGNPLYLRFYSQGEPSDADISLRDLEIRAFKSTQPRAREIASYLALAGTALSLDDLIDLLGSGDQGPEFVSSLLDDMGALVRQSRGRVKLVHEHLLKTLLDELKSSSAKLGFFGNRLGRYLVDTGEYALAFHVFVESGEQLQADRIIEQASHQVALRGGGKSAIPIFRRRVERARAIGDQTEEVHGLLALAETLRQTGSLEEAAQVLSNSSTAVQQSHNRNLALQVEEVGLRLDIPQRSRGERVSELNAIREKYAASGEEFDAARVATILSAEHIGLEEFDLAEQAASAALRYFEDIGDDYGQRVARVNLRVAISGLGDRTPNGGKVDRQFDDQFDPVENPRERAVICNLMTRRYRRLGDYSLAARYALEAIEIGLNLGDRHVIAINRTNLGNVRRDEGAIDEALELYFSASRAAAESGFRRDEASASELIASVYNSKGDYEQALKFAVHASNIARIAGEGLVAARANQERARALLGQGKAEGAVDAYLDAVGDADTVRSGSSFSAMLMCDALNLANSNSRALSRIFSWLASTSPAESDNARESQSSFTAVYQALREIVRRYNADRAIPMVALSMAHILGTMPPPIERRVVRQAIDAVLPSRDGLASGSTLTGIAGVLLACNWDTVKLSDLVQVADRLSKSSPALYFKPHPDGAAHWTIRLDLEEPVVVSITQMDDSPRTAVVSMCLALLMAGLSSRLGHDLLEGEQLFRREAVITVVSRSDFDANIDPAISKLGDMPNGFTVTQSTDLVHEKQPPTIVICADNFGSPWTPAKRPISELHLLFAEILRTLASHLLAREVEADVLIPKIGTIVRRMGFREGVEVEQ